MIAVPLPPWPHRPGQNARHAEDLFEPIKASAGQGMGAGELARSDAWRAGWRYLEAGYFWEAHEVWEAVWVACPPNSAERRYLAGLIQIANAKLKAAMGKHDAAARILLLAAEHLAEARARCSDGALMGRDLAEAETMVRDMRIMHFNA